MARAEASGGWRIQRSSLFAREPALLLLIAGGAWLVLIFRAQGMNAMGGTMGLGPAAFVLLWLVMMAAMMLPAVAPQAALYARTAAGFRATVLIVFAIGYLGVWALVGVIAFPIASLATSFAMDGPGGARAVAAAAFFIVGVYQLSPIKDGCLLLGRSPSQQPAGFAPRPLANLTAGASDGLFCVGSSWALMLVMVPLGFMNLGLMVMLAAVIFLERYWSRGVALSRCVGLAALVLAVASIWAPQLSSNLR